MKQYNLGPNGGILTSCNLFATRFDQVRPAAAPAAAAAACALVYAARSSSSE
jgi:hypothetical protein